MISFKEGLTSACTIRAGFVVLRLSLSEMNWYRWVFFVLLSACGVAGAPHMELLRKDKHTQVFVFTLDQQAKHPDLWVSGALYFSPDPQEKLVNPDVIANAGDLWRIAIFCKQKVEIEYGAQTILCDGKQVMAKDPFSDEQAKPAAPLEKGKRYRITWEGKSSHAAKSYFFYAE